MTTGMVTAGKSPTTASGVRVIPTTRTRQCGSRRSDRRNAAALARRRSGSTRSMERGEGLPRRGAAADVARSLSGPPARRARHRCGNNRTTSRRDSGAALAGHRPGRRYVACPRIAGAGMGRQLQARGAQDQPKPAHGQLTGSGCRGLRQSANRPGRSTRLAGRRLAGSGRPGVHRRRRTAPKRPQRHARVLVAAQVGRTPAYPVPRPASLEATALLSAGVPLKVIADLLGHTTIAVTANIYASVTPELRRDAADAMDRALAE